MKFHFSAVILIALSLSACAGRDFAGLREGIETRGHYIEGVPFFKQNEDTCGPAALAGVLAYWGSSDTLEGITAQIFIPKLRGTLPMDVENYARQRGFDTSSSAGTLDDIRSMLRSNVPVICLLDLGYGIYRRPHYLIAVGFDDEHTVLILHDGRKPNSVMEYDDFEKAWKRGGRWMLVIKPKAAGTTQ